MPPLQTVEEPLKPCRIHGPAEELAGLLPLYIRLSLSSCHADPLRLPTWWLRPLLSSSPPLLQPGVDGSFTGVALPSRLKILEARTFPATTTSHVTTVS
ncbi:hypothetical protein Nepgr_011106 [Nepenthes gracilis]|uniref:Uncharacterized protein n=1 Tax=Nepenthes gracilis TaxID=150966 RepID=A0AAD3SEG9_NEPGR|nr:hypothetical protein Nepgr_011106 [Nepenthes gracilis]